MELSHQGTYLDLREEALLYGTGKPPAIHRIGGSHGLTNRSEDDAWRYMMDRNYPISSEERGHCSQLAN